MYVGTLKGWWKVQSWRLELIQEEGETLIQNIKQILEMQFTVKQVMILEINVKGSQAIASFSRTQL